MTEREKRIGQSTNTVINAARQDRVETKTGR